MRQVFLRRLDGLTDVLHGIAMRKHRDVDDHAALLWGVAVALRPEVIVEIGVRKGNSTTVLAHAARTVGGRLFSVDIHECPLAERRVAQLGLEAEFSWEGRDAAGRFADGAIDLLFLDGDHSHAGVEADLAAWGPKIRRGGMVIAHDAERPGVAEPLRQSGWPAVFLAPGRPGLALLQRPETDRLHAGAGADRIPDPERKEP